MLEWVEPCWNWGSEKEHTLYSPKVLTQKDEQTAMAIGKGEEHLV